jgi:hypothetical protein
MAKRSEVVREFTLKYVELMAVNGVLNQVAERLAAMQTTLPVTGSIHFRRVAKEVGTHLMEFDKERLERLQEFAEFKTDEETGKEVMAKNEDGSAVLTDQEGWDAVWKEMVDAEVTFQIRPFRPTDFGSFGLTLDEVGVLEQLELITDVE